jgi:hypothetical protein
MKSKTLSSSTCFSSCIVGLTLLSVNVFQGICTDYLLQYVRQFKKKVILLSFERVYVVKKYWLESIFKKNDRYLGLLFC